MSTNIRVTVRIRPIDESRKEKWAPGFEVHGRRIVLGSKTFDPDGVLSTTSTQADVYDVCGPIIDSVKDGSNGTIMVYGQTGTGKTHTMLGHGGVLRSGEQGVAYHAIDELLRHVAYHTSEGRSMALTLSMLEIYNERITDMLSSDGAEVQLIGGFPRATTKVTLATMRDAEMTIERGLQQRHVASTAMNDRSSRSHVIIMVDLEETTEETVFVSHLFLADLAGSESIKKSQAVGKQASEAGMINKSLLALKNVILSLSGEGAGPRSHVPYRDSKLTELLQDSIGGSSRTLLIACISPVGRDVDETKSTLDYASKARNIRNIANTERDRLNIRIRSLELETQKWKNRAQDKMAERGGCFISREEHERFSTLEDERNSLRTLVDDVMRDREQRDARHHVLESQLGMMRQQLADRERAHETMMSTYGEALCRMERTSIDVQHRVNLVLNGAEDVVAAQTEQYNDRLDQWVRALHAPEAADRLSQDIGEVCQRINCAFTQLQHEVIKLQAAYANDITEALRQGDRRMSESLEAAQSALARAFSDINRERNHLMSSAHDAVSLHTSAVESRVQRTAAPAAASDLRAFVDRVTRAMAQEAEAHLPRPTMEDALKGHFGNARAAMMKASRDDFASALAVDKDDKTSSERPTTPLAAPPLPPMGAGAKLPAGARSSAALQPRDNSNLLQTVRSLKRDRSSSRTSERDTRGTSLRRRDGV